MQYDNKDAAMRVDSPAFLRERSKLLLIDGKWRPAIDGRDFVAINPASGEQLARLQLGDERDIDLAVNAARRAFEGPWRRFRQDERQRILLRAAELIEAKFEEIAIVETLDVGTPLRGTMASRRRLLGLIRYYAGLAIGITGEVINNSFSEDIFTYTRKEPVGVVAGIIPWNSPMTQFVLKVAPAIATGCTIVLKPAEQASLSSIMLGEIFQEAGCPDGVINIVTGYGAKAGAALAGHPLVDKVAFTGSYSTGQSIIKAAAPGIKRLSLELGGKSPNIIFADADLDKAVPGAIMGAMVLSGQACTAGARVFVQRPIFEEFSTRAIETAKTMKVGSGFDPAVDLGPLISDAQLSRVSGFIARAAQEGARLRCGGERPALASLTNGYFLTPAIFDNVTDKMEIMREEVFGPVLALTPFDGIDELVRRANDTPYGLSAGIWTKDTSKIFGVSQAIRAGTVWVNCYHHRDPAVPFGGFKASGTGRDGGHQHIDDYLEVKSVMIAH